MLQHSETTDVTFTDTATVGQVVAPSGRDTGQRVDVGARLREGVVAELDRIAQSRRWSRSTAIAAAVEEFVAQSRTAGRASEVRG